MQTRIITRKGGEKLTFAALYRPSQSQTETLCGNPGASDTAPKLLQVCEGPADLRFAAMIMPPSPLVPWQRPSCCSPFSYEPGLLPIHVRTRPASAKQQASFPASCCACLCSLATTQQCWECSRRPRHRSLWLVFVRPIYSLEWLSHACKLTDAKDERHPTTGSSVAKDHELQWGHATFAARMQSPESPFAGIQSQQAITLPLGPAWHALCWRAANSSLPMDSGWLLKRARHGACGL